MQCHHISLLLLLLLSVSIKEALVCDAFSIISDSPKHSPFNFVHRVQQQEYVGHYNNNNDNNHFKRNLLPRRIKTEALYILWNSRSSSSSNKMDILIEAASEKLSWEMLEEKMNRPILDLSSRQEETDSLLLYEDGTGGSKKENIKDSKNDKEDTIQTAEWDQGQRWEMTKQGLCDLGISSSIIKKATATRDNNSNDNGNGNNGTNKNGTNFLFDDLLLKECPQLLRFEPSVIMETVNWLIHEFTLHGCQKIITTEPKIISYKANDVRYGYEFMQTMMMLNKNRGDDDNGINNDNETPQSTKLLFVSMPSLLFNGIEGGLQERYASHSLSSAMDTTIQTKQTIVGNAMSTITELKNKNKYS